MSDRGAIFDLGYKPYDGIRNGRRGAILAVVKEGWRKVMGLRRRARRKVLPWALLGIALIPAVIYVGVLAVTGELAQDTDVFGHAQYFNLTGFIAQLFIALAAAELLVPDRVDGTMQIYASRPLRTTDYLAARAFSLGAIVFGFMMVPQLLLYLGEGAVSSDGFLSHVTGNLGTLGDALLASSFYVLGYAPFAFMMAALAGKTNVAAAIYLGLMAISGPVTRGLVDNDFSIAGLFAFDHHPRYLRDYFFDTSTKVPDWIPADAGYDEWVSAAVIGVTAVAAAILIVRRYRKTL